MELFPKGVNYVFSQLAGIYSGKYTWEVCDVFIFFGYEKRLVTGISSFGTKTKVDTDSLCELVY